MLYEVITDGPQAGLVGPRSVGVLVAGGVWNTVDNSYGQLNAAGIPIGTDKRYAMFDGSVIQANTIARGSFVSRWSLLGSEKFKGQDVMILSDATTVAGERLDFV